MDPREVAVQAFRAAEKRCRETPAGPSYIHELERLCQRRKLEIVFVDLAGPEVSGSNARAPEAITISEIVASLTTQGDGNPV
jgi:hypothetical protein